LLANKFYTDPDMMINKTDDKRLVSGPVYDLLLICIPLFVPISYYVLTIHFPSYNSLLFFIYLFILGETHFGATWLFFIHPNNRAWVVKNKYYSIYLPIIVIAALIILAIRSINFVLLIILIYNFFHVTRQSIGVTKIYANRNSNIKIELIYIYISNILCVVVGIFRFIIPIDIINDNLFIISCFVILVSCSYFVLILVKPWKSTNIYFVASVLTGIFLYSPLLFANTIQDAFAMGVGMHYSQYLAIVIPVNLRRLSQIERGINIKLASNNKRNKFFLMIISYLLLYSGIMVSLTYTKNFLDYYYLIPVFFQLAHFYLDSFTWRFSDEHIKTNIGKYIFLRSN
jgi:hypothetical protein